MTGRIVWVNKAFARLTGWTRGECVGRTPAILKSGQHDRSFYEELWRTIAHGGVWTRETVNRRKDGELYVEEQTITPVMNESGEITHFVAIKVDIRERKLAERALKSSQELYRALFEQSPNGVLLIDPATAGILDANPAASAQLGYTAEEFKDLRISDYEAAEAPAETARRIEKLMAEGSDDFETLHRTKGGEIRNVHVWVRRLQAEGRPAFHCIFEDITDRKRAEKRLITSLREKEALLREVHHRVKNNLQLISSLLRLETGRSRDPAARQALNDMQGRIQSMALLHEALYRAESYTAIDLGSYLGNLAAQVLRTLGAQQQVELDRHMASVLVGLDQAISCGLLLHELVSNCLKHAFPNEGRGTIRIELGPAGGSTVRLLVRDDGVGLPPDFDVRRGQSLGLQLVSDLAKQLKGRLEVEPGPGAAFSLTFSIDPIVQRQTLDLGAFLRSGGLT